MFEKCDPAVFYWGIRKFLAGSENNAGLGLPNGLIYKGVDNDKTQHFMGATAGQSSIFPALDAILGIQHYEKSNGNVAVPNTMLQKMSLYMPAAHRAFLDHLSKVANLRDYVLLKSTDSAMRTAQEEELVQVFDACVHQVKQFRDTHIQIVTRYIMTQARRGPPEGWEDYRVKLVEEVEQPPAAGHSTKDEDESTDTDSPMRGSGGSDLMPFLKTNRDETQSAKVIQPAPKK